MDSCTGVFTIRTLALLWDEVGSDFLKYVRGIHRLVNRCNIIVAVVFCVVIAGLLLTIVFWDWLGAVESLQFDHTQRLSSWCRTDRETT